jgi:tetratricopeptide (TPR) repeat protein/O-antigen ligase
MNPAGLLLRAVRLGAWAWLIVVGLFVIFIGGNYPWLGSQVVRITVQVGVLVTIAGWLGLAIVRPQWRPRRSVVLPVAVGLAAAALSTALSERPRLSSESLLVGAATALGYLFVGRLLADRWFRPRVSQLLVALPIVVTVGYLALVAGQWFRWWAFLGRLAVPSLRPGDADLTFGTPNVVAALLVLTLPFAVAQLAVAHRGRLPALLLVVGGLVAVLISGSRGAFLGVGAAAVALVGLRLMGSPWLRRAGNGAPRRPSRAVVAGGIAVVLGAVVLLPAMLTRLLEPGGTDQRLNYWRSAVTIWLRDLLAGSGPGTWVQLKFAANPVGAPNLVQPHAHDLYIQTLSEVGVIGLVAMALLVGVIGWRLVRAARSSSIDLGPASIGAILGLAALGGQSIVDNFENLPSIVLCVLLLVAWVEGGLELAESEGGSEQPLAGSARWVRMAALGPALLLAGTIVAVPSVGRVDAAALASDDGMRAADSGDWAGAVADYDRALELDPDVTVYRLGQGTALANLGDRAGAETAFRRVVAQDAYPSNLASLALLLADRGARAEALGLATLALDTSSTDAIVALNVGAIAERLGDAALAKRGYAEAIARVPEVAASAYWHEPARILPLAELVPVAHELARLGGSSLYLGDVASALIVAYAGDPAAAETELRALPANIAAEQGLAIVHALEGRPDAAISELSRLLDASPREADIAVALAQLEAKLGDHAAADRHLAWATILGYGLGSSAASAGSGSEILPARKAGTSGLAPNYPWMVYLRRAPQILTPPDWLVISAGVASP